MPQNVKAAGIVTNRLRDADLSKTRATISILKKLGIEPILPEANAAPQEIDSGDAMFRCSDFIITLGGDGTILSIAEKAALNKIPIIGINIGNLGYLTDCSFDEAESSIEKVIRGDYITEKRMMLRVTCGGVMARCLNDVCVTRGETAKIIRFDLSINDSFVDNYSADGIIISTPTGSTAYNLSAGGPILIPDSQMIAVTPVCPHMLTTRPIVAASDAKIKIVAREAEQKTIMTLDGRELAVLAGGDAVYVEKSEKHADIIKTNRLDFYDILRQKLIYSGVSAPNRR